jgi:BirA family transcriptional regulator, biotin operon repressor / biotin---[acetyl-CoA-carboxylase] ligase
MGAYSNEHMRGTLRREHVEPLLRGRFGRPYEWRDVCESTQDLARALPHGGVAACEQQMAGRGRMGRTWRSPHGLGVLCSLSLRPATPPERLTAFSLVAAEAVCEALLERAVVRWPNDVMVGGRKLAGVLAEARDGQLVVGIGVNANQTEAELPADARVPATSMRIETGSQVDRPRILADVVWALEQRFDRFEQHGFEGLERDGLRGLRVRLAGGAEGLCTGTDSAGRLIVGGMAHTSDEVAAVIVQP